MKRAPQRSARRQYAARKANGSGAAPSKRAASTGKFAVRVGTFDRIDGAKRLQRALGARGFDVAIQTVTAKGRGKKKRTQYVVQVGPYKSRGQAESAVRTMQAQVKLPAQIIQR